MTTINDLSIATTVSSADKLPIWQDANGVTRGLPISVLDSRYVTEEDLDGLAVSPSWDIFISDILPNPFGYPTFTAGTTTNLTLAHSYASAQNLEVHFDASFQGLDQYSLVSNTLSFNGVAIPVGVNVVYVSGGAKRVVTQPSDGSVGAAQLAANAVTAPAIAPGAVGNSALAIASVGDANLIPGSNVALAAAALSSLPIVITPKQFGAIGDGLANDGPALNAMFDHVRTLLSGAGNRGNIGINIDLSGVWKTNISINATVLSAWSLVIRNGLILGNCTGKCVLDLSGSRGYDLDNVAVYGDVVNTPSVGIQRARTVAVGACDNNSWRNVSTTGWFSATAVMDYGAETTHDDHCTFYNYARTGYVAVYQNEPTVGVASDYQTIVSGVQSFTNNKRTNCDYRYLPIGSNAVAVTNITNATNAVVTAPGHSFIVGDIVSIVNGMFGIDKAPGTVTAVTTNTFTININTTSLGSFSPTACLAVHSQNAPSVLFQGGKQYRFDTCYIVSYGAPQLFMNFTTNTKVLDQITFDFLFEGAGTTCNLLTYLNGNACNIKSFEFRTFSSAAGAALMLTDTAVGNSLSIFGCRIENVDPKYSVPLIGASSNAYFAPYFADILYQGIANVAYASYAAFNGFIKDINTGTMYNRVGTAI